MLSRPAPVAPGASAEDRSLLLALRSAVHAGLPTLAESYGEEATKRFANDPALLRSVKLSLADARLQRSDFAGAARVAAEIPGDDPAKNIRLGLAAYAVGNLGEARARLSASLRREPEGADAVWRDVLDGFLAAEDNRPDAAEQFFKAAKTKAAGDPLLEGQIDLLRARMRLRIRREGDLSKIIDPLPDSRQTYQLAKLRAIALGIAGKRDDALYAITGVPLGDNDLIADQYLTIGLLWNDNKNDGRGGRSEKGREALLKAVRLGEGFPEIQNAALAALRQAVIGALPEETLVNANRVFDPLGEIVRARPDSAVADMIQYVRADIMYEAALRAASEQERRGCLEKASEAIGKLEKSPASPLAADGLSLAANIAWRLRAYRRAADAYSSLANASSGRRRAEFLLAAADCYFLNGHDFAPAAAAYRGAREAGIPSPEERGDALVDEIRATLADDANAKRASDAATILVKGSAGIPALSRFQAEWLVADARRAAGENEAALALVNGALGRSPDAGMRVRFLWLRGMIELATGRNREAAATAGEIAAVVDTKNAGLPAEVSDNRDRILAQTVLLKARALLKDNGMSGARNTFAELREKYPNQASAAKSYLDEGLYLTAHDKDEEAYEVFREGYEKINKVPGLAENAAELIYEQAQSAMRLAAKKRPDMMRKAFDLFDRLRKDHPGSKLYFIAALYQGHTLRNMNQFDDALKVYRDLINELPDNPLRIDAELAKADCLLKKGEGADAGEALDNFYKAAEEYDRLVNLPGRPADIAAEAAFKRAEAVSKAPTRGAPDTATGVKLARADAAKVLWQTVSGLLNNPAEAGALGKNGRYWVGRSLLFVAKLHAEGGDFVSARNALQRLVDYNANLKDDTVRLPGEEFAKDLLLRYAGKNSHPS